MTTRLRGLVVDDRPVVGAKVKRTVTFGFNKIGWDVEWETAETVPGACDLVQTKPSFDFAIIDYELEESNLALDVVEELRQQAPFCYILVVTNEGNNYPQFRERSIRAGANDAIMRNSLTITPPASPDASSWDARSLARRIRRHLGVGGVVGAPAIRFADSPEVRSMLHSIGDPPDGDAGARGQRIARALVLECLEGDNDEGATLLVEHLAPGRSGAHLCKVRREQDGEPVQSFVVKMSLNHAALEAERRATQNAAKVLSPLVLVDYVDRLGKDGSSGYAALVARLADDVVTLNAWLTSGAVGPGPAVAIADELFRAHLATMFQTNLRRARKTTSWLALSPFRKLRIHEAVTGYTEVWKHERGADVADAERLATALLRFAEDGMLPGEDVPPMDDSVTYVDGFGDLHATNILVRTVGPPRPVLVDASDYGPQHWAGDAARLVVDLVLRARRSGVESMLWTSVAADAPYAGALCDCAAEHVGRADHPIDAFIGRVVTQRPAYLHLQELRLRDAAWHWQWHVALAREFLRQGSRPGLVPPTAVLALASAATHLERAVAALRG